MARTIRRFPESGDYLTFVEEFLLKNEPCMFSEAVTRGWRARRDWQRDGKPDLDYLATEFGDASVPVADCSKEYFDSHCKTEMKMADYLHYWRSCMQREGGLQREERGVVADVSAAVVNEKRMHSSLLYLKDWHFYKQYPHYVAYTIPPYFISDWLNVVWDQRRDVQDDYRFVYMGPKGTWTPFHADVFRSYSWSANVCGRKEWLLFPPGEENRLKDRHGRLPFDLRKPQSQHWCESAIRVIQEPGEIIFVPSCWYHQVHNLEDTISINHNWVNAFGVHRMWQYVRSELQQVKREIADCRDMAGWENHCQVVLRACVGIDYRELLQMLCLLAPPRLAELDSLSAAACPPPPTPATTRPPPPSPLLSATTCPPPPSPLLSATTHPLPPSPLLSATTCPPPPSPSFSALRQLISKVNSCRDISFFGIRQSYSDTTGGWSPPTSAATDRLKEVLESCMSTSDSDSTCVRSVLECLPGDVRGLAGRAAACDVLTRTLCTLRIFELHQIHRILTELLTDTDMQAVAPQDIVSFYKNC